MPGEFLWFLTNPILFLRQDEPGVKNLADQEMFAGGAAPGLRSALDRQQL